MACPHLDVRRRLLVGGVRSSGESPSGGPFHLGGRGRGEDRTGELLEPSLMPRQAEPRKVGCWSGVEGLAVVERQAPAGQSARSGMSRSWAAGRMLRALQQAGWMIERPVHDCLSRIEFERHRAGVTGSTLAAPNADNGLVAGVSPSAADGLRTRRISTVGVDFAANGPISAENALAAKWRRPPGMGGGPLSLVSNQTQDEREAGRAHRTPAV